MLSRDLISKYGKVLSVMTTTRGLPYVWNNSHQKISIGPTRHILGWLCIFLQSWTHSSALLLKFLVQFHSIPKINRGVHLIWSCGCNLTAVLNLAILFQAEELAQFFNHLITDSNLVSERLKRKNSSRKYLLKQQRLLELILLAFTGAAIISPAFVLGIFFYNPFQSQFFVPKSFQEKSHLTLFLTILIGLYETTWVMYSWISFTFFLFLEISFFFSLQIQLKNYRSELGKNFGIHKSWVLEYRKFQLTQDRFNDSIGRLALPFKALFILIISLIGNYGTIIFFQQRSSQEEHSFFLYIFSPFISVIIVTYELIVYPWMASINSISSSIHSFQLQFQRRWTTSSTRDFIAAAAYARSLVPLKVKIGPFRTISKSTILSILTLTVVSTARIAILFPVNPTQSSCHQ